MKNRKSRFFVVAAAIAFLSATTHADTLTFTFFSNTGADFSSYVDGTGPFVIQDIAATAGDQAFTFDLTLSGTLGGGTTGIDFNSQRPLLNGDTSGTLTKSVVVAISDVQGNVVFDGFSAVDRYDNKGGDNWDVNGEIISATGNNVALAALITGPMTITAVDDTDNSNTRFEGFDANFTSTIPEPATLGMVAAFGAGILFIRRRFMI